MRRRGKVATSYQASALQVPSDGSPVEVDVEIYPTGWQLAAGAILSIYHDPSHDSELVIPVRNG